MKKPQLTPDQFASLVAKTRLKEKGVELARAALVDGKGYAEIAAERGATRQDVYMAARRVLEKLQAEAGTDEVRSYQGSIDMFARIDEIVAEHGGRRLG